MVNRCFQCFYFLKFLQLKQNAHPESSSSKKQMTLKGELSGITEQWDKKPIGKRDTECKREAMLDE